MKRKIFILGAGMTGLAAGFASGLPVFEAASQPGGICYSYYIKPGTTRRLAAAPTDGDAYRFEFGGGHWIFGSDPAIVQFLRRFVNIKEYQRHASIYFKQKKLFVPYPIQNQTGR